LVNAGIGDVWEGDTRVEFAQYKVKGNYVGFRWENGKRYNPQRPVTAKRGM